MSEQIRENISNLSDYGPILPLIQNLQVKSFNYKKIISIPAQEERVDELTGEIIPAQEERVDELTGEIIPAQEETYVLYPEGIQVMIEPTSLESMYPEGVVTGEDGNKYYRSELVTAFLVQAVKEMYEELSNRLRVLESK